MSRCVLLGLVLVGPSCSRERPAHVAGGFLRDGQGRALILRGVDLASKHRWPPYFDFHQPEDFARVRQAWGMNALRFLISWAALEPQQGAYDRGYLEAIAERMDWAHRAGLMVVLDMHQDVFGEGFASGGGNGGPRWACDESLYASFAPAASWFLNYLSPEVMACYGRQWTDPALGERFAEAWRHVAARLADHPAVIGFDITNEPFYGTTDPARFERDFLQPFYSRVIAAVRSEAPRWVAFVEPASTRNLGLATSLGRFTEPDIVYAPHSYDPRAEQGLGFDPSRRDSIIRNIASLADEAGRMGAALWIGEYGGDTSKPGIVEYMDAQYDGASAVMAGTAYWDYSRDDGYGLLAPDGSEKKALLDVLVRPYPERIAGKPGSCSYDEAARRFQLSFTTDPSIDAPTEISVPERVYPSGYRASCQGCAAEQEGRLVRVTAGPAAAPAVVQIDPL